ncbi:MAG: redoxin domain-containing protein [Sphingobium sp.]
MISLGPLALAMERMIAILGIFAFLSAAGWTGRRHGKIAETAAWMALLAGVLVARLAFVVQNWPAFAAEPATILFVWQGGFAPLPGLAAAGIVLLLLLRGTPALRAMGIAFAVIAATSLAVSALLLGVAQRPLPPDIVVHSLAGDTSVLDARDGRPVVINLWATWCGPCQREMPMLVEEAGRSSVPILLVNQGEAPARVRAWLAARGLSPVHIRLDPGQRAAAAVGARGLPTTLFVDGRGMIREVHVGEISRAALLAGVRKLEQ